MSNAELQYEQKVQQVLTGPLSPVGAMPRPLAGDLAPAARHTCDTCTCNRTVCSGGPLCCF